MTPEDAYSLLEAIATISGSQDKLKRAKEKADMKQDQKTRKPPVDFVKCGIPMGAELVFIEDDSVRCTVAGNHKVLYGEELTSLSSIATRIKGYPVAGPSFFTYNGKLVAYIARETQWKEW